MSVAELKDNFKTPCCKQGVFFISGGNMKNIFSLIVMMVCLLAAGCTSIGNGVQIKKTYKYAQAPESISIYGDWRIEIICSSNENSCEIILDENLQKSYSVDIDEDLEISLAGRIRPMTAPIVRIKTTEPFEELELDGNSICHVKKFDSAKELQIELEDKAVCVFDDGSAAKIEAEISELAKLALKCKVKVLEVEADDRALLDVSEVDKLKLEASDNAICKITKCEYAEVEVYDEAFVEFKNVTSLQEKLYDNGNVKYPIIVPDELKQEKAKQ